MELGKKLTRQKIFRLFSWMIFVDVILLALAIHFYNGNFLFWKYPYSTAGVAYTFVEGNANTLSMYLFSLAMIISAIFLLIIGTIHFGNRDDQHRFAKTFFSFSGSVGFLITAFSPDDIRHQAHIWGMAFSVASIWFIAFVYTAELRHRIKLDTFVAMEVVLNLPIFAYAQAYFIKFDPAAYNFQKISLATVCLVLLWSIYLSQKNFTLSVKSAKINSKT